jgi:hypothetical protein
MPTYQELPHVIAFLLLLARLGDIGSTYLISPTLKLETNPIVRRFRWPFAAATVLAAALAYYSLPVGVAFLIGSLLVCAANCSRVWLVRTLGESEYHLLLIRVARRAAVGLSVVVCHRHLWLRDSYRVIWVLGFSSLSQGGPRDGRSCE